MFKKFMLLCSGLILCIYSGCSVNPITGEKELMFFDENQDVEIGKKYAPEVEKQMGGRIENLTIRNYINSIGQQIVQASDGPDFDYYFTVVNDDSTNAVSLPGGYVFITQGMLEKLNTEAQLAGILAHETAHIVARDSSAVISREIGIDLLLSMATSEDTPRSVLMVANLTHQLIGLRFSRQDERDADTGGLRYIWLKLVMTLTGWLR